MIFGSLKRYALLLLLIVLLFPLGSYAEKENGSLRRTKKAGQITVITRNNAHCYCIYREQPMGFEYSLAEAFANYLGVGLTVKTFPWADMIKALNEGKGDFIAASTTITPSRKRMVDFSDEYLSIQQRIIVHEDNHTLRTPQSLASTKSLNRLLAKSLFAWSKTFFDKSKARSRRCQNSPLGQGNVIVKPNLLIFELLAGYGCLFFGLCPHIV